MLKTNGSLSRDKPSQNWIHYEIKLYPFGLWLEPIECKTHPLAWFFVDILKLSSSWYASSSLNYQLATMHFQRPVKVSCVGSLGKINL